MLVKFVVGSCYFPLSILVFTSPQIAIFHSSCKFYLDQGYGRRIATLLSFFHQNQFRLSIYNFKVHKAWSL